MQKVLGLFVKHPVPGGVKTRLGEEIGMERAAEFADAFQRDLLELTNIEGIKRVIAYSPNTTQARASFQDLVERPADEFIPVVAEAAKAFGPPPSGPKLLASSATGELSSAAGLSRWDICWPQPDGNLTDRLTQFFEQFCDDSDAVIAIGSDSPNLPGDYLDRAFESLRHSDLVLGPAMDGGYYLVGLRRCIPELFSGINWSTARVLEETVSRARSLNLSFSLLPPWYDVDHYDNLRILYGHLLAMNAIGQAVPTRTFKCLRQLFEHE